MFRSIVHVLILALISFSPLSADESSKRVPEIDEILQRWRAQQEKVKTLYVEFRHVRTMALFLDDPPGVMVVHTEPPPETTVELSGKIWIDGNRWRADDIGPSYHQPSNRLVETRFVRLFDGNRDLINFDHKERTDKVFPTAMFYPTDTPDLGSLDRGSQFHIWLLNVLNHDPIHGVIRKKSWRSERQWSVINGHDCFPLVEQSKRSGVDFRYWVAPDFDFRVVRWEVDASDLLVRSDIQYERHPDLGWVPNAWDYVDNHKFPDGKLRLTKSEQYTVEKLVLNEPLPDDPFGYKVPAGTWVNDFTKNQEASKKYLAGDSGVERPILKQELARGARYTDLLNTESGEAGRPSREADLNWWFWGSILVFIVALGSYILQRRR